MHTTHRKLSWQKFGTSRQCQAQGIRKIFFPVASPSWRRSIANNEDLDSVGARNCGGVHPEGCSVESVLNFCSWNEHSTNLIHSSGSYKVLVSEVVSSSFGFHFCFHQTETLVSLILCIAGISTVLNYLTKKKTQTNIALHLQYNGRNQQQGLR